MGYLRVRLGPNVITWSVFCMCPMQLKLLPSEQQSATHLSNDSRVHHWEKHLWHLKAVAACHCFYGFLSPEPYLVLSSRISIRGSQLALCFPAVSFSTAAPVEFDLSRKFSEGLVKIISIPYCDCLNICSIRYVHIHINYMKIFERKTYII